jgi:hypothetical protein
VDLSALRFQSYCKAGFSMNTAEISLRCTDYLRALNSISQNQALRQGVHPAWNSYADL